jgi:hypothetical protein
MGAIKVHEFTTVDGVVDVPMWTVDHGFPDDLSSSIGALTASSAGILLGRTTFEMFAPAWSTRTVEDDPGAPFFNDTRKYVITSTLTDAETVWRNSTALGGYSADRICSLKDEVDGIPDATGAAGRRCAVQRGRPPDLRPGGRLSRRGPRGGRTSFTPGRPAPRSGGPPCCPCPNRPPRPNG